MCFVFFSLFMDSLQYFVCIGIHVKVHFLVIMFDEVSRISSDLLIEGIVIF